jgi:ribokinase
VAVITVAEGGGNTIVVAAGATGMVTPEDVDDASHAIAAADVVLMQLEVPVETVTRAAALARARGTCVLLNAAPARSLPKELLALVDVLIVNETEGGIVSAGVSAERGLDVVRSEPAGETTRAIPAPEENSETLAMLARLASLGAREVIVTFGEAGAAWIQGQRGVMVAACDVEPVDTVGAGDSFCGALAATWPVHGADDTELMRQSSLRFASGAGALATTTSGAIPSLPTLMQVQSFLKQTTR